MNLFDQREIKEKWVKEKGVQKVKKEALMVNKGNLTD